MMEHHICNLWSVQASHPLMLFHWSVGEDLQWVQLHIHIRLHLGIELPIALLLSVPDVLAVADRIQVFHMDKQPSLTIPVTLFGMEFPICHLVGLTVPTMEIVITMNLEWVYGCSMYGRQPRRIKVHATSVVFERLLVLQVEPLQRMGLRHQSDRCV